MAETSLCRMFWQANLKKGCNFGHDTDSKIAHSRHHWEFMPTYSATLEYLRMLAAKMQEPDRCNSNKLLHCSSAIWLHMLSMSPSCTCIILLSVSARLRLWCVAALVAGEALRTCTLVSTPYHWTFQILWVLYWLTICLLVTTTTWLLAIQPVRSAKKAAKVGLLTLP